MWERTRTCLGVVRCQIAIGKVKLELVLSTTSLLPRIPAVRRRRATRKCEGLDAIRREAADSLVCVYQTSWLTVLSCHFSSSLPCLNPSDNLNRAECQSAAVVIGIAKVTSAKPFPSLLAVLYNMLHNLVVCFHPFLLALNPDSLLLIALTSHRNAGLYHAVSLSLACIRRLGSQRNRKTP
ncbi:hypothetical protein F4780DRAFT_299846 [Xylariomycetidae sp. FL0641]|nr:hypothetical protein F4780DRAFT_299846 [Xylariomycetidae sp. FL0641]